MCVREKNKDREKGMQTDFQTELSQKITLKFPWD